VYALGVTTQTATLVAAVIAASATIITLILDVAMARGAEARAAHREVLAPHLAAIGEGVHQVLAGAVILHRRAKQGQSPGAADRKAGTTGAALLKELRLKVKYPLAGIEEPLRTLSRAYDWAQTFKGDESGDAFIEAAQKLGREVDSVIARSYSRGTPPRRWEQWRLARRTADVRDRWTSRFPSADADELPG
jgi:hypothetical protein